MFVPQIVSQAPQAPEKKPKARRWPYVLLVVPLAVFGITLAVIVARHLTPEAQAVLAGAACGLVAAVPVSLAIVAVTGRMRSRKEDKEQPAALPGYPMPYGQPYGQPPIVIQTTAAPSPQPPWTPPPAEWGTQTQRKFTEIGAGHGLGVGDLLDLEPDG
jgi:hypothetical protein